jgi:hypothetical protein
MKPLTQNVKVSAPGPVSAQLVTRGRSYVPSRHAGNSDSPRCVPFSIQNGLNRPEPTSR